MVRGPTTCCATATAVRWPSSRPSASPSIPADAAAQAKAYAEQLKVPYIFLSNGHEVRFWEWQREAFPARSRPSSSRTTWSAAPPRSGARDPLKFPSTAASSSATTRSLHRHPLPRDPPGPAQAAGRDGHRHRQDPHRRRLHQAPVRGQRRHPRAVPGRSHPAGQADRGRLRRAPADYPAYVLRAGRRFQDEKRITITTLQSMVNIYAEYSSGISTWSSATNATAASMASGAACSSTSTASRSASPPRPALPTWKMAARRGDKLFVRDTLRFFEVDKPDLLLQAEGRHPRRLPRAVPDLQGQDGQDRGRRRLRGQPDELDWSAMDATTRAELEQDLRRRQDHRGRPLGLERRFTIPERNRAIVREFRQVLDNGYLDARACCASRCSARPSSSPSPSATPKRWRNCSMQSSPTRSLPEVRYADYVVSGMGADDTMDGMTKIRASRRSRSRRSWCR
jgi:type I restriction enzyme R subunit